jgi:putative phosphoribosyl transferase
VPLDVLVARKIGAPFSPEVGIGALAGEDPPLYDEQVLAMLDLTPDRLGAQAARERAELHRCEAFYRAGRPKPDLRGREVVDDDGLATGITARAALRVVRAAKPARVVLAVPVSSAEAAAALQTETDEFVCLLQPRPFGSVGQWYEDFEQVGGEEVTGILKASVTAP